MPNVRVDPPENRKHWKKFNVAVLVLMQIINMANQSDIIIYRPQ